jgi:uncharacterized protein YcsI (UPF0317 family)
MGFAQANVVVIPALYAPAFALFCQKNPKPCPVLEVMEAGVYEPGKTAPGADIRSDCPRYRVFRHAELVEERGEIAGLWSEDLVTFLLGCSFTFEGALVKAGVPLRHVEEGVNVPMYVTKVRCAPAPPFAGNMVVSMRPMPAELVDVAVRVTSRYPGVHGAPVHAGEPMALGIRDLYSPDFGDPVTVREGEVPVFWACGVTPQVALLTAKLELAITHAPGHMFVTDVRDEELAVG